jgi:hypothetical protein
MSKMVQTLPSPRPFLPFTTSLRAPMESFTFLSLFLPYLAMSTSSLRAVPRFREDWPVRQLPPPRVDSS